MKTNKKILKNSSKVRMIWILFNFLLCIVNFSCKKYLDEKSDKKLVLPTTLQDCQALLDNYNIMNNGYPNYAEAVSDNIYLLDPTYNSLSVSDRNSYVWNANADPNFGDWTGTYQRVLYANQVLETLNKIQPLPGEQGIWNQLKGTALFFRGYAIFQAAQIWTKPYDLATANQDLGIPFKLTTDLNEKTDRGSVQQTYDRILQDLQQAVKLLPNTTTLQTRPTATAGYAALARVYLAMGDYSNAGNNADACLQKYNILLDYNQLMPSATFPFSQFNKEVIFASRSSGGAFSIQIGSRARVDSTLYNSYETNDLRKRVFFTTNNDNTHGFKGSYDGSNSAFPFNGLATDEVYLIRAECYARAGKTTEALSDLNLLLKTRYSNLTPYINKTASSADSALILILAERRKELLFREVRWSDLRRLNKDSRFAITIFRKIAGQTYSLPPNDLRYVLRIPTDAINRGNIQQNPR